jgi:multidrug efflux pump subunit AcrB
VIVFALLILMFKMSQSELAPEEDQGIVLSQVVGAPTATSDQMQTYAKQIFEVAKGLPEYEQMFQITGVPTTNPVSAACCSNRGTSVAVRRTRSSRSCRPSGTTLPAAAWRPSSSRRCRAVRACRCSS